MASKQEKKDAELKAAAKEAEVKEAKEAEAKKKAAVVDVVRDLYTNISLLEKGVISKDARMISRVLRSSHSTARRLTAALLRPVIEHCFPVDAAERAVLLAHIDRVPAPAAVAVVAVADEVMADAAAVSSSSSSSSAASASEGSEASSSAAAAAAVAKPKKAPLAPKLSITPEVEAYLHLVVLTFLCAFGGDDAASLACSSELLARVQSFNRRTLDQISARAWAQYALLQERRGREALAALRPALLAAHRTACLRHDEPSQAVLINLILRNYLEFGLYAHADKFRLNAAFPENRSNYQHARYLYYTGRINVVQLDYSDAYTHLTEALRKAPSHAAVGFRQAATKLLVIVQLLMGEVPERSLFRQHDLARSLRPYLRLTQAVRVGDLAAFAHVCSAAVDGGAFRADRTSTLVARLRHNVIKIALRQINVSYSRIPLADVAAKLALQSEDDAAGIVAKAIHDGVIDASIDYTARCVCSNEAAHDVYTTGAPRAAFHARIGFCLELRNQAVKAMRFPMHMQREDLETEEERAEREAAEEELLAHLGDGGDGDEDGGEDM